MLLYIHVPFCRSKCRYCAFFSRPLVKGRAGGLILRGYLDTLLAELALWGDRLGGARVESVFFGGGTPSLLPPKAVGVILDRVRKSFQVEKNAEISLEANPESFMAFGYAYELAAAGVNRLSLGAQSMDPAMLRLLGRPHTVKQVAGSVELARQAGFANVNLDLIWGLPEQRERDWLAELKSACRLRPDHFSCYGLTLEDGTPMATEHGAGRFSLPPEREQAAMYMHGAEFLESQGYMQYEISNYARMGFQCRHNLGYWEGSDYLGLGPAAVSTIGARRWANPEDVKAWAERVSAKTIAHDAEELPPATRVLETVMLRLRTVRGLRVKAYQELTGRDFLADNKSLLHLLHKEGLVRIRHGYVCLTRTGMLVSNTILERLFDDLERQVALSREPF